jgi:hypothetical protein
MRSHSFKLLCKFVTFSTAATFCFHNSFNMKDEIDFSIHIFAFSLKFAMTSKTKPAISAAYSAFQYMITSNMFVLPESVMRKPGEMKEQRTLTISMFGYCCHLCPCYVKLNFKSRKFFLIFLQCYYSAKYPSSTRHYGGYPARNVQDVSDNEVFPYHLVKAIPVTGRWRPIGLWDVKGPTLARQSVVRMSALRTARTLFPRNIIISVRGWVNARVWCGQKD